MAEYKIVVDAGCDLPVEILAEYGIKRYPLTVTLDDREPAPSDQITEEELYTALRNGKMAKTAATSMGTFLDAFDAILREGHDLFYIGFSSGLSSTYRNGELACSELRNKYPERKVVCIDTLSASAGYGLSVLRAAKNKEKGMSLEENEKEIRALCPKVDHQFTVDDLFFLKRGGRISAATALIGTMLQFKPVMHMDDPGHLVAIGKVRGRKAAIKALVDKMEKTQIPEENDTILISHGDCLEDAETLAKMIEERLGYHQFIITGVGPTIGAHSGPGTLALFYVGTER